MQGAGNASQWNALSPSQESELANAYYSSGDIFNIFGNAQEFTGVGNASTSGGPIGMASTGLGTSAQAAKGVVGQGVVGFVTGAISEVRASFSRHLLALVVGLVVVVVLFH
jgi:exosortase/archaeosortase